MSTAMHTVFTNHRSADAHVSRRARCKTSKVMCLAWFWARVFVAIALTLVASNATAQPFDVVIADGRVMDPESGLDAVLNVGVRGGKV